MESNENVLNIRVDGEPAWQVTPFIKRHLVKSTDIWGTIKVDVISGPKNRGRKDIFITQEHFED